MIKITTKLDKVIILLGLLSGVIATASATSIQFTYSGSGSAGTTVGSGSFSYSDGLNQIGLADLNFFSFNLIADYGDSVKPRFSYSLGDITDFNAIVDQNLLLTNLTLTTNTVFSNPRIDSIGRALAPAAFNVNVVDFDGGASLFNGSGTISAGIATQTIARNVDEPSVFAYFGFAFLLYFFNSIRRKGLSIASI
jgi:hypothetical protein